jgi:hypothetical protein
MKDGYTLKELLERIVSSAHRMQNIKVTLKSNNAGWRRFYNSETGDVDVGFFRNAWPEHWFAIIKPGLLIRLNPRILF